MTPYEEFCRAEAARRGIGPETAVTVANSEGGLEEPARRGTFDTGSSWWAFQLHYGGAGYEQYGTTAGMGNGFTALTGWAPGDPDAWKDAMRYALDAARRNGWGAWYGAAARGIHGFDGINLSVPWTGTPQAEWDYLRRTPVTLPAPTSWDPTAPSVRQPNDWSCSIASLQWLLHSLGRGLNAGNWDWLVGQLVPQYVTPDSGLLDHTGGPLAAWLTSEYYPAVSQDNVTFEAVAALAGHAPAMLGGRTWNHWTGVRGVEAGTGRLLLANPSPGWMGVGDTLTRDQFDQLGPFSLVTVPLAAPTTPPPVPPVDDRAALIGALGYACGDLADRLQAVVDELRRVGKERGVAVSADGRR